MTNSENPALAELAVVDRGGFGESRHYGSLVALAADGTVALSLGMPETSILPRSSVKPWQAITCIQSGISLSGEQTAVAAGSHTGQDPHVRVVSSILADAGLSETDLGCPPDWPEDESARNDLIRRGQHRAPIRMNCSGKHAAMLAACVHNSWDVDSYLAADHPLQRRIRETLEHATGNEVLHVTVDGCGAPLFATTILGLARAGRAMVVGPRTPSEHAVADAMRAHPYFVGGSGHPNTEVMRRLPGTLCKGGAEGVIVAAAASGQAVAIKVIDGAPRATTMLALAGLAAVGVDTAPAGDLTRVEILGGGRAVGEIRLGEDLRRAIETSA